MSVEYLKNIVKNTKRERINALRESDIMDIATAEDDIRGELKNAKIKDKKIVNSLADKFSDETLKTEEALNDGFMDKLTGLWNKQGYEKEASRRIAEIQRNRYNKKKGTNNRERREQKPFWLFMIDIDNFKSVNDKYGHLFGDDVLKRIAVIAKKTFRGTDTLTNWGGDEFAFLVDEGRGGKEGVLKIANKFRLAIQNEKFKHESDEAKITVNIGVAKYNLKDKDIEDVFVRSDRSLYAAKGSHASEKFLVEGEKLAEGKDKKNSIFYWDDDRNGIVKFERARSGVMLREKSENRSFNPFIPWGLPQGPHEVNAI